MCTLIGLRATAACECDARSEGVSSRWVHEEIGEGAFAWQGLWSITSENLSAHRCGNTSPGGGPSSERTFQEGISNCWNGPEWNTTGGICGEHPSAAPAGAMPFLPGYRWLTPPANLVQPYGPGDVFQAVAFGPRDEARGSAPFDESASKSPAPSPASGPGRFPA